MERNNLDEILTNIQKYQKCFKSRYGVYDVNIFLIISFMSNDLVKLQKHDNFQLILTILCEVIDILICRPTYRTPA